VRATCIPGAERQTLHELSGSTIFGDLPCRRKLRKPPSSGLAIAGATGVSGSSACRVPKLMLPSESAVSRVAAMTAIEGGVIDGRAFYRFQAQPQQLEIGDA
jgi:hypothetical protein